VVSSGFLSPVKGFVHPFKRRSGRISRPKLRQTDTAGKMSHVREFCFFRLPADTIRQIIFTIMFRQPL